MSSRIYGDPRNTRNPKADRFGRIPSWAVKSPTTFKHIGGVEAKLLAYLAVWMDNQSNAIPKTSPSKLAREIGYNRNRVSEAVKTLAMLGVIALKIENKSLCIQVLADKPGDSTAETKSHSLDARQLDSEPPSSDCKKSWRSSQGNVAEVARKSGGDLELESVPGWVTENEIYQEYEQ